MAQEWRATQSLINIRREPRRFAFWYEEGNATILADAFFYEPPPPPEPKFTLEGAVTSTGLSVGERIVR